MDFGHLEVYVSNLLAFLPIRLPRKVHHALEELEGRIVVALLRVNASHDLEYLAVTGIVHTFKLLVHLKRFLEEADRVSIVTSFEVALAELIEDVSMIVSCLSHALEQLTIDLEGACKVLKGLLVALERQIGFA